jgi:hypothetical protein
MANPSRLAEDGEHLRMTVEIVAAPGGALMAITK